MKGGALRNACSSFFKKYYSRLKRSKVIAVSYQSVVQPDVVIVVKFSVQFCYDIRLIQLLQDRLCVIQVG